MEINRNNYQAWITAYLDGSLSEAEENELILFLAENSDLASEFELYGTPPLHPDISVRINKETLKKDYSQLTEDQKAELIIALCEDDLAPEDARELTGVIERDPIMAASYREFSAIRLKPEDIIYPDKIKLKRIPLRNSFRKVIAIGLASAASLAIMFSLWVVAQKNNPLSIPAGNTAILQPAVNIDSTSQYNHEAPESAVSLAVTAEAKVTAVERESIPETTGNATVRLSELPADPGKTELTATDPVEPAYKRDIISIDYVPSATVVKFTGSITARTLAEMKPVEIIEEPEGLSPRQFIAMTVRKRILKEKKAGTEKLRPYEVADATMIGMNKLLGWEMSLEKEKDENGNLNSLKFTSQLIKFDHKVKNRAD